MLLKNVCNGMIIDMTEEAAEIAASSPYYVPVDMPAVEAPAKPTRRRKSTNTDDED